jgi:hypothetical protein
VAPGRAVIDGQKKSGRITATYHRRLLPIDGIKF